MDLIEKARKEAEATIARLQAEADEATLRLHFTGSPPKLRNDSQLPEHGNTLTDSEYEAVQSLAAGKAIPKKILREDEEGEEILKDGVLAVAVAVARVM